MIVETSEVEVFKFNQNIFSVKTIIYTSALMLALCCGSAAMAQSNACKTTSCPDSVLLSKRTDGNYEVRQYLVKGKTVMEEDCTVHFPINSSKVSDSFSDNAAAITSLKAFMAKVKNDTLINIKALKINGWASPDGAEAANQKLAKARVQAFVAYLMAQCPSMKNFAIESSAEVATWKDCLPMLSELSVANRAAAEQVINGNHTEPAKEMHLSKMPAVWSYLKSDVLPEFRCAELEIHYCRSSLVEQRVMIKKPTPTPAPAAQTSPQPVAQNKPVVIQRDVEYLIIEDKHKGIILEMEDADVDWD